MARNATNKLLQNAKKSKSDEFYTQLSDIESELQHYKSHFENKVVYCNCDVPRISNFFKYFAANFKKLGLKKIITSCYREQVRDLFREHLTCAMSINAYSSQKLENLEPDHKEK